MSLENIKSKVEAIQAKCFRKQEPVNIIAVSKVQPISKIVEVLEKGHRTFGENRVQETLEKWPILMEKYEKVELHLVGSLQTNKVKEAIKLFNVIHSIDREKLILKISNEAQKVGFCPNLFIQVNTGNEIQKSGVKLDDLTDLLDLAKFKHSLPVIGLMCLPPANEIPSIHFKKLYEAAQQHELTRISMGMSNDFEEAIMCGATDVRIGSAIFGPRG